MRVVFLRSWDVQPYAATYSTLRTTGIGGTDLQLLQHANALWRMGHEVTILGVVKDDLVEQGVTFRGTKGKRHILELLAAEYHDSEILFVNVVNDLAVLRNAVTKPLIIEVCQNGPHFANDPFIDLYAFVGFGQFAHYSVQYRRYRHKFVLLPNVPPWKVVYSQMSKPSELDQIVWVGSANKQGLRRWAKAMSVIMGRHQTLKWVLCLPSYDFDSARKVPEAFAGIELPHDRIQYINLPSRELALELAQSKIVLASLGGEDGPVAYLDGHAAGTPVLCGDDIYGKYSNPEGMGFRCTTVAECIDAVKFLLEHADVRRQMGELGRRWIAANFTEDLQAQHLAQITAFAGLKQEYSFPVKASLQSDRKFSLRYWFERLEIKIANRRTSKPVIHTPAADCESLTVVDRQHTQVSSA